MSFLCLPCSSILFFFLLHPSLPSYPVLILFIQSFPPFLPSFSNSHPSILSSLLFLSQPFILSYILPSSISFFSFLISLFFYVFFLRFLLVFHLSLRFMSLTSLSLHFIPVHSISFLPSSSPSIFPTLKH